MITVDWKNPSTVPEVAPGTEELFWVAAQRKDGRIFTYLAQYQNRPLVDEEDEQVLVDDNGDAVESIGWVRDKAHYEFENFYEPIVFNHEYQLLGWAEYEAPCFPEESELFNVLSDQGVKDIEAAAVEDFSSVLFGAIENNYVVDWDELTASSFKAIVKDHADHLRKPEGSLNSKEEK